MPIKKTKNAQAAGAAIESIVSAGAIWAAQNAYRGSKKSQKGGMEDADLTLLEGGAKRRRRAPARRRMSGGDEGIPEPHDANAPLLSPLAGGARKIRRRRLSGGRAEGEGLLLGSLPAPIDGGARRRRRRMSGGEGEGLLLGSLPAPIDGGARRRRHRRRMSGGGEVPESYDANTPLLAPLEGGAKRRKAPRRMRGGNVPEPATPEMVASLPETLSGGAKKPRRKAPRRMRGGSATDDILPITGGFFEALKFWKKKPETSDEIATNDDSVIQSDDIQPVVAEGGAKKRRAPKKRAPKKRS